MAQASEPGRDIDFAQERRDLEMYVGTIRKFIEEDTDFSGTIGFYGDVFKVGEQFSRVLKCDLWNPFEAVKQKSGILYYIEDAFASQAREHPEKEGEIYGIGALWILTYRAIENESLREGVAGLWRVIGMVVGESMKYPAGFEPRS